MNKIKDNNRSLKVELKRKYKIVPEYDIESHKNNAFLGNNKTYTNYVVYKNNIPMIPFCDKFHATQAIESLVKAEIEGMKND